MSCSRIIAYCQKLALLLLATIFDDVKTLDASSCPETTSVELLQREISVSLSVPSSPSRSFPLLHSASILEPPTPLYWLHIPKCNSGFGRSLLLLPGVCDDMSESSKSILFDPYFFEAPIYWDPQNPPNKECQGIMDVEDYKFGAHRGIGPIYSEHVRNHGMVILRQPEQRILSAWNDDYHSWPWDSYDGRAPQNVSEFVSAVSGCATKMLTRAGSDDIPASDSSGGACGDPIPPSEEEIARAIDRLQEGFPFVGILEEYDLSICLLHKMYGGTCKGVELQETHVTEVQSNVSAQNIAVNSTRGVSLATTASVRASTRVSSEYDTSVLNGWVDKADRAIYIEGQRIFAQLLERYGVSEAACQTCWEHAW